MSWGDSRVPEEVIDVLRGGPFLPSPLQETAARCTFPVHVDEGCAPLLEGHHCSVRFHVLVPRAEKTQWAITVRDGVNEHQRPQIRANPSVVARIL